MTSSSAERCLNFILLVLLKKATTLVDRSPEDIKHACEKACVVPDVLPFAPRDIVKVKYFHGFIANLGNKLITNDVHIPPNIMDWPTKNNTYYTIVFVGPDEPSAAAASKSQIIYWLKSNIYEQRYMETGDTIVEYTTPEPLKGTSWHRYVYVVYEQPHGNMTIHMEIINSNSSSDPARAKFSAQAFAMKHKLGDALAMQGKTLKTSTDGWITLHQYILMSIVALVPVKAEIMEPESCLSNNTAKLISSGIMSVLNFSYTPPAPLLVEYRKYPVRCGKKPNPTVMEVAKEPYFFYPDPYRYVTLTMLDIDPPSPELPIFRSILHLLLCNIPQNDIKKGIPLAEYLSPDPPSFDPHRYVCLVFLQKALLPESICTPRRYNSTLDRYGVNITMILAELRLSFYDLYAINFFYLGKSLLT